MKRAKWKMKSVSGYFRNENNVPKVRMECGHTKTDPFFNYGNETTEKVKRAYANFTNEPLKMRCYECGRASEIAPS